LSGSHVFHPTILREYDIRGLVGDTLSAADARALGRAFGTRLDRDGGRRVCVGYDGRLSSPDLEAALVEGLVATGLTVQRIGRGPTPMLYYAVHALGADGGVMVTGSHNPPDYNGFKLMLGHRTLHGREITELGELAAAGEFTEGVGSDERTMVMADYVDALAAGFGGGRALTVAWDAGNGAAGEVLTRLAARLPGRHVLLNETIDGTFPAHHPDPTVTENLVQLQETVSAEKCDLGVAFDGDGDRIGIVDGAGRIIWGDQIIALLAREVLAAQPGATVIADVKASQMLFDEIARLGGTPLMWRTGHSLIKSKMAELGAPLAGEMSGHIFFADRWYGFDDALYVAVRFLALAAQSDASVVELHDSLPVMVNTPELRFECPEERKFEVISEVQERLAAAGAEVNDIDGVRVSTPDGWWLLRASNTQAVLVARCEAADDAGLARLKDQLVEQLHQSGIEPPAI
jgi:phosphomannomutase